MQARGDGDRVRDCLKRWAGGEGKGNQGGTVQASGVGKSRELLLPLLLRGQDWE
jgi:hypothetical protein